MCGLFGFSFARIHIIEIACSVPITIGKILAPFTSSKYKVNNGISKWVLKEAARKFIPKEIVERVDKRGFSAPVNKWFGWDKVGKYDRNGYKILAYEDWKEVFNVFGAP